MAIRQPIVMNNGVMQQLQAGDAISVPANTPSIRSITNAESSVAVVFGTPLYASAADQSKRAQANTMTTATVTGLVYDPTIAAGATGYQASSNVLVGTTAQWDVVAGTTGGLAFGQRYFLDPSNVGKITSTAPTSAGQYVVLIGIAISTTELELKIGDPILL